jgi:hypothetical protein
MTKKLKNFLKGNKEAQPRTIDEIRNEANQLTFQIGNMEYVQFIQNQDLEVWKKRLQEVNREAAARQKLDAQAAEAAKNAEAKIEANKTEASNG